MDCAVLGQRAADRRRVAPVGCPLAVECADEFDRFLAVHPGVNPCEDCEFARVEVHGADGGEPRPDDPDWQRVFICAHPERGQPEVVSRERLPGYARRGFGYKPNGYEDSEERAEFGRRSGGNSSRRRNCGS